jgi:tRNA pseudouridine55 synthase
LQAAALAFTGLIQQTPPMYSAIKVEGTRLYALAREGLEVPREPRTVEILQLIIAELHEGCFRMDVTCSKGTYIRTLAEDIATSVGQVAHLTALRRLSVGGHLPEQMHTLDSIKQASLGGYEALDALLLPSITLLSQARQFVITPEQSAELFLGRDPPTEVGTTAGEVVFMNEAGLLMGLGAVIDLGMGLRSLHAHRWFDGIR